MHSLSKFPLRVKVAGGCMRETIGAFKPIFSLHVAPALFMVPATLWHSCQSPVPQAQGEATILMFLLQPL